MSLHHEIEIMKRAYSRSRRVRHAIWFLGRMAREYPGAFERTISAHVGQTYGLETPLIKRIKARFRNELSFGEGK